MIAKTLYTGREIAEILGVSRQLVWQFAAKRGLGTIYGNQRLFSPDDLAAFRGRNTRVGNPNWVAGKPQPARKAALAKKSYRRKSKAGKAVTDAAKKS